MQLDKKEVQASLRTQVAEIIFRKLNGEVRKLKGTLLPQYMPMREEYVPNQNEEIEFRDNPDIVSVWDIENSGWRTFRLDSVISMQRLENY